jgi:hypothetical protein
VIIIMIFYKILALFHSYHNVPVRVHPLWHFWWPSTKRHNTTGYILYHVHTWLNCSYAGTFSCT